VLLYFAADETDKLKMKTEHEGHENGGPSKLQDVKLTDQVAGHKTAGREFARHKNARNKTAGHENARREIAGQKDGKCSFVVIF